MNKSNQNHMRTPISSAIEEAFKMGATYRNSAGKPENTGKEPLPLTQDSQAVATHIEFIINSSGETKLH